MYITRLHFDGSHTQGKILKQILYTIYIHINSTQSVEFFRNPKRGPEPGPFQTKDRDLLYSSIYNLMTAVQIQIVFKTITLSINF